MATLADGTDLTSQELPVRILNAAPSDEVLVASNSVWRYLASHETPGAGWRLAGFPDAAWPAGPARIGDGSGGEATVVALSGTDTAPVSRIYLRHGFVVPNPAAWSHLVARLLCEPGGVVHLNGHEIHRHPPPGNPPAGRDTSNPPGPATEVVIPIDPAWLKAGANQWAVEIEVDSTSGARLTFGLELAGRRTLTEPWIVQQPTPQACREGTSARFEVRAAGEPVFYQWHRAAGEAVPGAQGPVLFIPSVSTADAGDYLVTVSNALGSVTSIVASLALLPPDTDGDGMPDSWESRFGLDPRDPRDAAGDLDRDGISNLEEYQLGSSPVRAPRTPTVLISEILYHPKSGDPREEFIELLNTGLFPVNLQGWRFTDGIAFAFPSLNLPAGGRLVVAADPAILQARHPAATNVLGPWTGRLSNSGEALVLQDASRREVDRVRYADEGDWALRRRGAPDRGTRGWEWYAEHDGHGRSLELVQPHLPNDAGQNWSASLQPGGTPGAPNSSERDNVAPLIQQVAHQPIVPAPSQPIRVTALVTDEDVLPVDVRLHYRGHSVSPPSGFEMIPMTDDGRGADGLPGDGIFAAEIPAHAAGTVLEYYVSARDNAGLERTWPAAVLDEHGTPVQEANANLQVVDSPPNTLRPLFRLILTESERRTLESLDRLSNAELNATWVSDDGVRTEVRHNAGLRIRGAATRSIPVPNLRLNFPSDRRWHDVDAVNLNTYYWAHSQVVGSVLSLQAGIPAARARAVELHLNGTNRSAFGAHVEVEVINADWAASLFPNDPDGNVYFARRPNTDLAHLGTDPARYRATGYSKESNQEEEDWSDLIRLTEVLNNTPDAEYPEAVRQVLDPLEWVRYFALNSLLGNGETSLASGVGDDYDLYRGRADPRFLLVAHDWDSILSFANSQPVGVSIFQATAVPPVARFLKHPEFAPLYYAELQRLLNTVCSPARIHATLDQWLTGFTPPAIIDEMKQYATLRTAAVQAQIPTRLTVQHPLPVSEAPLRTTQPVIALQGQAHAASTRAVRINGQPASWTAWQARWSHEAFPLLPGLNRLRIESLDASGTVTDEATLDVWFDGGSETEVLAGTLDDDRTWTAAHGPYFVHGSLTVPPGRTLTIQAGTTVFLAAGAELTIQGTLRVEGTPDAMIRFAPRPGTTAPWGGIRIANSPGDNRLTHAILENPANRALWIDNSAAWLEGLEFITTAACLHFNNASLMVKDCRFPRLNQAEAIAGNGILPGGQMVLRGNLFGGTTGYADLVDITAGKRPGPILQAYDNLFTHGSDDGLDLDGTDAHIEGNVFMHIRQDAPRDSQAAAIATDAGADIVAVRNIFVDCDHAVLLKNGAFLTSHHNLYLGSPGAAVLFGSTNRAILPGRGASMAGDIFWMNARTFDQHDVPGYSSIQPSVTHSLIPDPEWAGNLNQAADPLLVNLTNDFRLRPGSPALGRGP
ncbi:MAG TPA: CotH kinase family protein, partial [Hyphomonas sp.]|nr:CotH kinase family protein [Hyphomonas sp.]